MSERMDHLAEMADEGALKADGFDDACIGIVELFTPNGRVRVLGYDVDMMVDLLAGPDQNELAREDALEYLEFNTFGAYVGPGTPAFITRMEP